MLKIRVPYSGLAVLLTFIFVSPPLIWLPYAMGIVVEALIATLVFTKLMSQKEFNYGSFIGKLLLQYTIIPEIGIYALVHLICARIVCYAVMLLGIIFTPPPLTMTLATIVSLILYSSTIIHYLPYKIKK